MTPTEFLLFEVIITFAVDFSIHRRREAINTTLKQIEGEWVAVVSKRMKSLKIYFDQTPNTKLEALICNKQDTLDLKLRANKKSIIMKKNDGSIHTGDPYMNQTIERYLEDRANSSFRRLALLEYRTLKDVIEESDGTFDKVYSIENTKYESKRSALYLKRKNHFCKLCLKKHVRYDKNRCNRTFIVVKESRYNNPGIRGNQENDMNVSDGRAASSTVSSYLSFSNIQTRLSSFKSWKGSQNSTKLAEHGFFYKGVGDTTTCYSCGVTLKRWEKDDDPLLEHIRYSPTCNYLECTLGKKTIQEFLAQCGKESKIDPVFNAGVTWDGGASGVSTKLTEDYHKERRGSLKSVRSPQYQSFGVRLSTFAKFPNYNEISIYNLATAGFYYTGIGDVVRCYCCDLGLNIWEHGDDPIKEHTRYLPGCDHLRSVKGEDFISQNHEITHLPQTWIPPKSNSGAGKTETESENSYDRVQKSSSVVQVAGKTSDKERVSTNFLFTPAAQSVLEHGYRDELVLAAIKKLNITDESKLTAMKILEVILGAEDNGIDLVDNNSKDESQKCQSENFQKPNEEFQQLLAENQKLRDMMLCKNCQAREKSMLLLPCAHRSLCHECANKNNLCPECWKPIKERVRTYMA